jgi:hypothetical protein
MPRFGSEGGRSEDTPHIGHMSGFLMPYGLRLRVQAKEDQHERRVELLS